MKNLPLYISLLLLITCAKEDSQAPNTPPTQIVKQYALTASAGDGGSVSGGGTFASGTQVSLTATPSSGYSFSGWSTGSTTNPLTVTLNSNTSITANFQVIVNSYTLSVTAGEGGSVSTEGGEYEEGTEVTITAIPDDGYEFTEEGIHRIIQIFPKENEPSNIIIYDFEIQYLPFINLLEDNEAPSAAIVSESSNLDVRKIKISYDEEFDLEKFKNIDGEYYPPTFPYMRGIMFINKPNKNFCISKVNLNFEDSIINSVWDNLYIEGGSINARVYDVKIEQKPLLQGGAGIGVTHSFDTNMIVENSEIVAIKSIIFLEDLSYNLFYNSFKKGNSFLYLKNNNILGLLYSIYMKAGGLLSEGNRYIIPSSADGQNIYFSGEQNEEDLLFEKQITQRVFDGDVFYLFDDLEYIPIINLNLERPDVWIGDNPLKFVFYHLDIINLEDLNYMISSVDLKSNYYELSIDNLIEFYDVFLNIPTNYYLFTDINKNKISLDAHIIVGETLFHKQKELKIGGGFID